MIWYGHAIEAYQKAVELNPKKDEAYSNMGNAYTHKGEYDHAIEAYQKAVELNPQNTLAYKGMGYLYHRRGEKIKAYQMFQKAAEIDENFANEMIREYMERIKKWFITLLGNVVKKEKG